MTCDVRMSIWSPDDAEVGNAHEYVSDLGKKLMLWGGVNVAEEERQK